jgi:hypothetical protein
MTKYDQPEHTRPSSGHHHPLYRTKWYYGLDPSPQKSARKDIHLPIVSENQNDPQHKNILQSKPNFVPENKNDLQHHTNLAKQTKFLFQRTKMIRNTHKSCKANQVFVPENKNDPQHTNFSCQL